MGDRTIETITLDEYPGWRVRIERDDDEMDETYGSLRQITGGVEMEDYK